MIDEVPVVGSVEEHGVGRLADFERSDLVREPERGRGVQGHPGQRFFDREPGVETGVRRDGGKRLGVARAGIRVGGDRDRHAG